MAKSESVASGVVVEHVGPIARLEVPIQPGIVLLTGRNGSGKSTGIAAVESGLTGRNKGLMPTDGKKAGTIRTPGVTLRVGARVTKRGEATHSYVLVEGGQHVANLIDPGIKDAEAADRRRIEALLHMIGASSESAAQAMREMIGEENWAAFSATKVPEGLVEATTALKRWLQKQAREHESAVQSITGAIEQIGVIPDAAEALPDADALRAKTERLGEMLRGARQSRQQADDAIAALEKEFAGVIPDVAALENEVVLLASELQERDETIAKLNRERQELVAKAVEVRRAIDDARKSEKQREALRAAVDQAPSAEDVQAMAVDYEQATAQHEQAVVMVREARQAESKRAELTGLKFQRERGEAAAEECREKAKACSGLIGQALQSVKGWSIDDDTRLCVQHKRGVIPFAELSPGERVAKVLELQLHHVAVPEGELPVVCIPQEVFEAMDETNRKAAAKAAETHGVCVVAGAIYVPGHTGGDGVEAVLLTSGGDDGELAE